MNKEKIEKLEKGMYVRTKKGLIAKIINIFDDENIMKICGKIQAEKFGLDENEIIKASHNIIDLIEVGDYVNGHYVVESSLGLGIIAFSEDLEVLNSCNDYKGNEWIIPNIFYKLQDLEIRTIVTKQQMESMQYEVK